MKRSPIEVFSDWALADRDKGMEHGHGPAVFDMLNLALPSSSPFSFLDAGCGNGWVPRMVRKNPLCLSSEGVDGSYEMIKKARSIDPDGTYHLGNLDLWNPSAPVDIVHSMEVFYYIEDISSLLGRIYEKWLTPGGILVIGVDFYAENLVSHDWPEKCQIDTMKLYSSKQWKQFFANAGFQEVTSVQLLPKENWAGTLCVLGKKV